MALDHCPALAVVDQWGSAALEEAEIKLLLLPSCTQCNVWLGAKPLMTPRERKKYVAGRWERLLKRNNTPYWTQAELDELGPSLRQSIEQAALFAEFLRRRIDWARFSAI